MLLNSGINASVFANGYPNAATPSVSPASPQASGLSVGQKAFGVVTGGSEAPTATVASIGLGTLALAGLIFIWWSLPR